VFSAPVYIRGFVRLYATLLKLDVGQIMSALDAELAQTEKFREPPPLTAHPKSVLDFVTLQLSKVNWRRNVTALIALLVVAVVVGGISIWLHNRNSDPLADLPPAVYQPTQPGPGEVLPLPTPPPRPK
jgi:cytoskeletal protein RodZ